MRPLCAGWAPLQKQKKHKLFPSFASNRHLLMHSQTRSIKPLVALECVSHHLCSASQPRLPPAISSCFAASHLLPLLSEGVRL